jgi:signal transduction histidine kinase
VLAGATGLAPGGPASPLEVGLDGATDAPWPFEEVLRTQRSRLVIHLESRFPELPSGAWDRPPKEAMLLPFSAASDTGPGGVLVVGLNPFRKVDDGYRGFLELVAGQIAASVANAHAHEEEQRRLEKLAEIDRAKTAFFSNVSHEFRTPLTLMIGPTEAAQASLDGALRGEELEMVHRNELRLLKLVNTLLDFSRIEAGRAQASYEPTDLALLTADLASAFRSAIERGGLRFVVECPPLPEPVFVDHEMWEKIVLNLVSNAFKFTFEGEIAVRLAAHPAEGRVELTVSDTGVGMPEEELPRVFDRFHRVEGARSRSHEGSGIGLALIRDLVRLHGGQVAVASALDRGTTFTVSIPLGSAHLPPERVRALPPLATGALRARPFVQEALRWLPQPAHAEGPTSSRETDRPPSRPGARLLVADDNADMREYLVRLLRQHWVVEAVTNGREALEAARRDPPDLLLTDVMMPVMDGIQLVRAVRADPGIAGIPVMILSARAGEEAAGEALRIGADDYLVKPFSASSLVVRVEAQLAAARAKAAARDEAQKLRQRVYSLFMDGPGAVAILRGDDLIVEVANQRLLDLWGRTQLAVGKPLTEVLPELEGQGFFELPHEVMRTGVAYKAKAALARVSRRGDGTLDEVYVDFTCAPLREDDDDGVSGVVVFAFDVSEQVVARRAAEEARAAAERAKADAEAASRAKDEFLAMLGHELRNPLAPIVTALDLLRDPDRSGEAARVVIERQVGHLVRLIDDLFDVSRITRGKIELKRRVVEAAEVVAEAIEMASPLLEQASHELVVDVAAQGLAVEGDPTRLAQVVGNLVTNAAKYTRHAGQITVRAAREGSDVVIAVSDNGIGIAPEMMPHIFDAFVQEPQAIDRARGGLGLGLAIVKNLVDAHGGTVSAESAGKGKGSRFTVRLPAARPTPLPAEIVAAPATSPPARARRPQRILVVDDNEDAATMLAIYLRGLGHHVDTAFDGPSALRAAAELVPEVALVDIGLPVMDGYEVARRLKREPALAGVRLVAVTGYGQTTDRLQSQAAGFELHLVKPVERARFKALLEEFAESPPPPPPS